MTFNPDRHHRRSIRLRGYDYACAGAYYVTICTQGRSTLFGDVVEGQVRLNDAGEMVQATWDAMRTQYAGIDLDAFVAMPNHIHGIVVLVDADRIDTTSGQPRRVAPTLIDETIVGAGPRACPPPVQSSLSLPDVVHRFKTLTTKRYIDGVNSLGWSSFRARVWQRNYYERIIRNDNELHRIRQYIADNPKNWAHDRENPDCVTDEPLDPFA